MQDDCVLIEEELLNLVDADPDETGLALATCLVDLQKDDRPGLWKLLPMGLYRLAYGVGSPNGDGVFSPCPKVADLFEFYFKWVSGLSDVRLRKFRKIVEVASHKVAIACHSNAIVLLEYRCGNQLRIQDIEFLKPGAFVGDANIIAAPAYWMKPMGLKSGHFVASIGLADRIVRRPSHKPLDEHLLTEQYMTVENQKHLLVEGKAVAFIVNAGSKHFAVIILDAGRQEAYYLDSLLTSDVLRHPVAPVAKENWLGWVMRVKQYCQAQAEYCREESLPFNKGYLQATTWGSPIKSSVDQQGVGSNDCGPFALMHALEFVSWLLILFYSKSIA